MIRSMHGLDRESIVTIVTQGYLFLSEVLLIKLNEFYDRDERRPQSLALRASRDVKGCHVTCSLKNDRE